MRRKSPAATTRISDTAICATTSVPRTAKRRSPAMASTGVFERLPWRNALQSDTGATPATIAEAPASADGEARTRQSSARSSDTRSARCSTAGRGVRRSTSRRPVRAPHLSSATIRLSVKSSRASRQREPPSANLTLSSRRRARARATSRLAMFVQATSSSEPHGHDHREERRLELLAQRELPVAAGTRVNGSVR